MALADFGIDVDSLWESVEPATDLRRLLGLSEDAPPRRVRSRAPRPALAAKGEAGLTWDRVVAADLSPDDVRVYGLLRRLRRDPA